MIVEFFFKRYGLYQICCCVLFFLPIFFSNYSQISDNIPGVHITCNEPEILYRIEKNDIFTWTYEIHSQVNLMLQNISQDTAVKIFYS